MNISAIAYVFTLIFIAELGDKTQLATFVCAGCEVSKWSVFIGSSLALVTSAGMATILGGAISEHVPAVYINRAGGAIFIAFGVFYLVKS